MGGGGGLYFGYSKLQVLPQVKGCSKVNQTF